MHSSGQKGAVDHDDDDNDYFPTVIENARLHTSSRI